MAFRFSRSAMGLDNLPALVAGLGVAMPANCGLQENLLAAPNAVFRENSLSDARLRDVYDAQTTIRNSAHHDIRRIGGTASRGIEVLMPLFRVFPSITTLSVRTGLQNAAPFCSWPDLSADQLVALSAESG